MESLFQDLRFGLRSLIKTRGVTTIAVITLALGIGANTAIFSVINAVLLQPLPFRDPGQLVRLYETESAPGQFPFAGPDFLDWKTQNHTFTDMALYGWGNDLNMNDNGHPDHVIGVATESNFFELLGARPMIGRTFAPGEDLPGKEQVAILSYALWQGRFGGDEHALGKSIELNAKPYTVIGVMPPTFRFPYNPQLWFPLLVDSASLGQRGSHSFRAIGRLKPGVTVKQAQTELSLIAARLEKQYPGSNHKVGAIVLPLQEDMVSGARDSLIITMSAVALVLLIACANVANLLLSRAVARQREMAIRSALGAARARLIRQLLTESILLALLGGALGLGVAYGGVKLLTSMKGFGIPATNPIQLSIPVLLFTLALASIAGLLFGIFPALQTSRPDLFDELKGGAGSSVSPSRQRRFTSNALVVAEVGISLLLLISAGLLLKDLIQLRTQTVGVRPAGVWTAAVRLPQAKYTDPPQRITFAQSLLEKLRAIPGVDHAALTDRLPLEGGNNGSVTLRGEKDVREGHLVEDHGVTPDYFRALGVALVAGRELTEQDVSTRLAIAARLRELRANGRTPTPDETNAIVIPCLINHRMAELFWPGQNPIGQVFSRSGSNGPWRQVVGVVADNKQWGIGQPPQPENFDAFTERQGVVLVLHTTAAPESLTAAVRSALSGVDSSLPLFRIRTMTEVIAENASGEQFLTTLLGIFSGLALLLAAVGIYGVLSYLVTQRTREIGIRMSLGASRADVLRLVLGQGVRLALAGFVVGIAAALAARKMLMSSLHNVKPHDPAIFIAAAACLGVIALLACYIPARRAAKVDPMVALRYE